MSHSFIPPPEPTDNRPVFRKPIQHRNSRRMLDHDYTKPCVYMMTFLRSKGLPPLSILKGIPDSPGTPVYSEPTEIGNLFLETLASFSRRNPKIKDNFRVIMPDHVHIIFEVTEKLERSFMWYMGQLKSACTKRMRELFPNYADSIESYFIKQQDNDKILYRDDQWRRWQFYIADNPRRAFLRQSNPEIFKRASVTLPDGKVFQSYGNPFLLHHPEKAIVRYTSRRSEDHNKSILEKARQTAKDGGVLVSPFIHPKEKELYHEGLAKGWKMIRITDFGFLPRQHPAKQEFNHCSTGKYLIIALNPASTEKQSPISRSVCQKMNRLAEFIATSDFMQTGFFSE